MKPHLTNQRPISPTLVFKRAMFDTLAAISWPKGPAMLIGVLIISMLLHASQSDVQTQGSELASLGTRLLVAFLSLLLMLVAYHLLITPYRIQKERADAAESYSESAFRLGTSQVDEIITKYYESAHTFVHFWTSHRVSLSKNIQTVCIHSEREFSFYFAQALDRRSVIVRPMAGTPRIEIVHCDDWHVRIRLSSGTEMLKLQVLGSILPVLRNHTETGPVRRSATQMRASLDAGVALNE